MDAHLSQEQLAERADLSVRTVSDLERGVQSNARRSTLERLARALELTPRETAALVQSARPETAARPLDLPLALRSRVGHPPLVGRDHALETFRHGWARARAGQRVAVVYSGEAGIGKSSLLAELAAERVAAGTVVLAGRCDDSVQDPYGAVVEALRPMLRDDLVEPLLVALGPTADDLALIFPELAPRVRRPGPGADLDTSRSRLLEAIETIVATLARATGPATLVIDDLHAADPSTLGVLRHLLRSAQPEGLMVVAGYRDSEVSRGHALLPFFEDLQRDQVLVRAELGGLDRDALDALVTRSTGASITPEELDALQVQTGGNPFFVEEILSHAAEQGLVLDEALATIPAGARDVVRARVGRLSPAAQSALETGSVVGNSFTSAVVERVVGARVSTGLQEAARSGFISRSRGGFSFRHGIVRAALLEDLGPLELAGIHWRVGEALEREHELDLERHLPEIAHHLRRGVTAGDPFKASEYLARLGRYEYRALALTEAVESLTAALAIASESDADGLRRMAILETLAETHFWRDDPDAMRGAARAAADLARRYGTPEDLGRTAIVAARWNSGGELEGDILDLLDEAAARLGPIESPMLSQVLAMRAYVLQGAARGFDTRQLAEEAELIARRCGDAEALTMALLVLTYTAAGSPTVDRSRRIVADLEEVAARVPREDHRRQYGAMALRARAQLQLSAGDRRGFAATRSELGVITETIRATFLRSQTLYWDAAVLRAEGRFSEADQLSGTALETWNARPDAMRIFLVQTAMTSVEQGDHERVLPEIERLVAGNTSSIGYAWRAVLAAGFAATGRVADARARLDELSADKFRGLAPDHHRPPALRWLAEVVASLDHVSAAETLLPILEPYSGLLLVGSGIMTIDAAADRAIAQLLFVLGRFDDADAHYERARTLERTMGFEALELRTRLWHARLLQARAAGDDLERGQELALHVAARGSELGMRAVAASARELVP